MIAGAGADASHVLWEGAPVKHVYVGTGTDVVQVWPPEVWVPITATIWQDSRDQPRAAATSRGIDWATATALPFGFDLSGATVAERLLSGWTGLTGVRIRNTSAVTNMRSMFNGCSALTSVPALDTSAATTMAVMFQNCSALTSVPALDTSAATQINSMFNGCSALTSVPALDTSAATTMDYMFQNCSALTSVPALDTNAVTTMDGTFTNCPSLTSIGMYGQHVTFSIAGTKLAAPALNALFSQLGTANAGATLTITGTPGAATCDRSIATAKGWTITG